MKKFSFTLFLIVLGFVFSTSILYAEMAKEGSGTYRTGKSGIYEVLKLVKDRLQMNYDETGVFVESPENSPLTNASYRVLGTLHAINGKFKGYGSVIVTRPNGDQIFLVYNKNEGILGVGPTSGVMEIIGGTGECTGIEGTLDFLPRPKVKSSKKGTYQGIGIGKISWKIP
jgi:hypothetical protein